MNVSNPAAPSTVAGPVRPDVPGGTAHLVLFEGDSTRMVPLPADGALTLGRGEGCALALAGTKV
ncbi:MAG: hypothetical protein JNK82_28595, partial [Myxococcaceae bacterium]|nr:hypothetical protein [Myxococcaceae bacterium]